MYREKIVECQIGLRLSKNLVTKYVIEFTRKTIEKVCGILTQLYQHHFQLSEVKDKLLLSKRLWNTVDNDVSDHPRISDYGWFARSEYSFHPKA